MDKLVSIITPVFKVDEQLFIKAVSSVISQSYQNWELIIIDDGNPQSLGRICDEVSEQDQRIRVIHKENGGVSSARNEGLMAANGEYVTFMDADDYLEIQYIEYLVKTLELNKSDISICCCKYIENGKEVRNNRNSFEETRVLNRIDAIEHLCYMKQYYYGNETTAVWGKLYKRVIIGNTRFDEQITIGEDFVFNYRCYQKAQRIVIGNRQEYDYRISANSLIRSTYTEKKGKGINSLVELLNENHHEYEDAVLCRIINILLVMLLMIRNDEFENDKRKIKKVILKYRSRVIMNKKARNKVRMSLILTYLGFDTMQKIFALINR